MDGAVGMTAAVLGMVELVVIMVAALVVPTWWKWWR